MYLSKTRGAHFLVSRLRKENKNFSKMTQYILYFCRESEQSNKLFIKYLFFAFSIPQWPRLLWCLRWMRSKMKQYILYFAENPNVGN
jgi:hypothetical protein